jgi:hypothetical protein
MTRREVVTDSTINNWMITFDLKENDIKHTTQASSPSVRQRHHDGGEHGRVRTQIAVAQPLEPYVLL